MIDPTKCKFCSYTQVLACCALFSTPAILAAETLLFDDFDAGPIDGAIWGVATWNIGDRTQFGNQPEFGVEGADTYVRLPLDTWNPNFPAERVLGTEIYSLQSFENDDGIEFLARARLDTAMPGLVAAFFTYSERRQKGRYVSDEIDFEVLSKQAIDRVLVTSWDDWGAAGSNYEDGVHHLGSLLNLPGFDWQGWNTYAMRWYPDRVEWYVNDVPVWTHPQAPVPDQPQPIRASLWAAGTTWGDAYDPFLAPVASVQENARFYWDIDYIVVTRLGGDDPQDPGVPAAPGGLAASVADHTVSLSWNDVAVNETGYVVYRAWKPKGKANPDFALVASLSANTSAYQEVVQDGEFLYRVAARNGSGESAPSDSVTVTVGSGGKGGKPPR